MELVSSENVRAVNAGGMSTADSAFSPEQREESCMAFRSMGLVWPWIKLDCEGEAWKIEHVKQYNLLSYTSERQGGLSNLGAEKRLKSKLDKVE